MFYAVHIVMVDYSEHDDVSRELIKCVVVGDTAVGKTRLICCKACKQRVGIEQLLTAHTPTVWAIDRYRTCKQVLANSYAVVDGINVSLRLWDTFGDHNNDRFFAYAKSDVVLLCFSVASARSLLHCRTVWWPEIRRMCPGTPVVLVGCQNDLRHLYWQPWFNKLAAQKRPFGKAILARDIVYPEQGRGVAKDISSLYYETSVLTHFGVDELFENVIRAVLCKRRQARFWMTTFNQVMSPRPQHPFLPPQPTLPQPTVSIPSFYIRDMESLFQCTLSGGTEESGIFSNLHDAFPDCTLEFQLETAVVRYQAHRLMLAASSEVFRQLLLDPSPSEQAPMNTSVSTKSTIKSRVSGLSLASLVTCSGNDRDPSDDLECLLNDFGVEMEYFVQKSDSQYCLQLPQGIESVSRDDANMLVIRVHSTRIPDASVADALMRFIYVGQISIKNLGSLTMRAGLKAGADLFKLEELTKLLDGIADAPAAQERISECCETFMRQRNAMLSLLGLKQRLFSDVEFVLDGGGVRAHRFLLSRRSEVMQAMLSTHFIEGIAARVVLPGVHVEGLTCVLWYLYTDTLPPLPLCSQLCSFHGRLSVGESLDMLEVANRFCLSRLVSFLEVAIIGQLNEECRISGESVTESDRVIEDTLQLLEPAQLYNASQLASWCLQYLSCAYSRACKLQPKLLKNLPQTSLEYLSRNRWPPLWYVKELEWFEGAARQDAGACSTGRLKRARHKSGCLCFATKSSRPAS